MKLWISGFSGAKIYLNQRPHDVLDHKSKVCGSFFRWDSNIKNNELEREGVKLSPSAPPLDFKSNDTLFVSMYLLKKGEQIRLDPRLIHRIVLFKIPVLLRTYQLKVYTQIRILLHLGQLQDDCKINYSVAYFIKLLYIYHYFEFSQNVIVSFLLKKNICIMRHIATILNPIYSQLILSFLFFSLLHTFQSNRIQDTQWMKSLKQRTDAFLFTTYSTIHR